MDENDVKDMMAQLGGMTALSHADLPARIFAMWAQSFKSLTEALTIGIPNPTGPSKTVIPPEIGLRVLTLMGFCIGRMEMVAATQPRTPSATEEDAS